MVMHRTTAPWVAEGRCTVSCCSNGPCLILLEIEHINELANRPAKHAATARLNKLGGVLVDPEGCTVRTIDS